MLHAGAMHADLAAPALPATPAALDLLAGLVDFFACRLVPRQLLAAFVMTAMAWYA